MKKSTLPAQKVIFSAQKLSFYVEWQLQQAGPSYFSIYIAVDFDTHFEQMYKVFSLILWVDKCLLQVGSLQLSHIPPSPSLIANSFLHI
jgi:hypothetical protein